MVSESLSGGVGAGGNVLVSRECIILALFGIYFLYLSKAISFMFYFWYFALLYSRQLLLLSALGGQCGLVIQICLHLRFGDVVGTLDLLKLPIVSSL